ncbi:MAG TPA: hypothetical protein VLA93_21825 [Pyrinomonadaceae bacterium]|nr:hypothetical protein [Pyrinomonadaceae bacterium]
MSKHLKKLNARAVRTLEGELKPLFDELLALQIQVRVQLTNYADNKALKGYEIVGWLGEVYVKLLFDGKLVDDRHEHDVETRTGWRISVKTRKGKGAGWKQSSPISKFEGEGCPTHLAFVHLHDNYSLDRVWLFEWSHLCETTRFTAKNVRGKFRSYVFKLDETKDKQFVIYNETP